MVRVGSLSPVSEPLIGSRPENPAGALLGRLVQVLGGTLESAAAPDADAAAPAGRAVTGMTLDSRSVRPGDLYAAVPGSRAHGARFVPDAVAAGARAVLTDAEGLRRIAAAGRPVPVWVVDRPRAVLGGAAAQIYGHPAAGLRTIGVTGTHGKTTTCFLLEAGLAAAGETPAVVGTVGTRIAGNPVRSTLTTPEAPDLHALFAVMREHGVTSCAMEVSSHALVMGRVDGVRYDLAVFTNLGRDHLDFHRDMEDYFAAKAQLFTARRAVRGLVNADDPYGRRLLELADVPLATFSAQGAAADWRAVDLELSAGGSRFTVVGPDDRRFPVTLALPGAFNVANALAAVAALGESGVDVQRAATGLTGLRQVPGRMQRLGPVGGVTVVVDYAHKPDAVRAALAALAEVTTGRLVCVLGAGGERDTGKRPLMGQVAAELADVLVVTDDNPRGEDPAAIRAEVLAGARQVPAAERAQVSEIGDRGAAIRTAIGLARPGDTVLVAGKGHEQGQEVAGVVHPFDDRDIARAALAARGPEEDR